MLVFSAFPKAFLIMISFLKKNYLFVTILLFLICFSTSVYAAGTPSIFGYQGRLADSNGDLLGGTGTAYYFKFSIWNNSVVGSGTKLWPSNDPNSFSTTVRHGVFNVNIGDTAVGFPDALNYNFNTASDIYLQVEVSSNDVTFQTLSPRQRIASTPFAQLSSAVSGTSTPSSFGTTTPFGTSVISVEATSTLSTPLSLRAFLNQTANLFKIQDATNVNLFSINSAGGVFASSTLNVTGIANLYSSLNVSGTATSTFAGGLEAWGKIAAPYFNATSTTATSTLQGTRIASGGLTISTLDCTSLNNGGTLTTDAFGNVICANDDSTAGAGGEFDWKQLADGFGVNSLTPTTTIPINIPTTATSTFGGGLMAKFGSFWNGLETSFITATSTATSTFVGGLATGGLSTSNGLAITGGALKFGTDNAFTSLLGSGLLNTAGVLTLDRTGDWTGTLDGYEGATLASSFSTTSAAHWLLGNLAPFNAASILSTSTATSTFAGGLRITGGLTTTQSVEAPAFIATSTTATSTFAGGALFATGGGNVGIGTTTTSAPLTIEGGTNTIGQLHIGGDGQGGLIDFKRSTGGKDFGQIGWASNSVTIFQIKNASGSGELRLLQSSPTSPVGITLYTSNVERLRVDGSGNIGIGTTSPSSKLTLLVGTTTNPTAGIYMAALESNTGSLFTISTSTASATSTAFIINSVGKVGIGTTSPSQELSVQGNGYFSGTLAASSLAGATSCLQAGADGIITRNGSACGTASGSEYDWKQLADSFGVNALTPTTTIPINITSTATSTFGGGLMSKFGSFWNGLDTSFVTATSTTATSTFAGGLIVGNNAAFVVNKAATVNTLIVAESGNVGIGMGAPVKTLDIQAADASLRVKSTSEVLIESANAYADIQLTGSDGADVPWLLMAGSPNAGDFAIKESSLPAALVIKKTTGNVGIGSSTPAAKLSVNAASTGMGFYLAGYANGTGDLFKISTSTASATSTAFLIDSSGRLAIGTTTIANSNALTVHGIAEFSNFVATSSTATSTIRGGLDVGNGSLFYDYGAGETSITNLNLGNIDFDTNAGSVSWIDLPVNWSVATDTPQSYTAFLGSSPMLTVYGTAFAGSVSTTTSGVGIASTTPWAKLSIEKASSTIPLFVVAENGSTSPMFIIASNNFVGVGTTSPSQALSVQGNGYFSGTLAASSLAGATSCLQAGTDGIITRNGSACGSGTGAEYDWKQQTDGFGVNALTPTTTIPIWIKSTATSTNLGDWQVRGLAATSYLSVPYLISTSTTRSYFIGNVGIGTTTPYAKLSVVGEAVAANITATSTTATSTFSGGFYASGLSVFDNVQTGALTFENNAGWVSWMDLPITSSAPTSTSEAYSAQLNGNQIFTIYGEAAAAAGAGGVSKVRTIVGTSTAAILTSANIPYGSLLVADGALCVDDGNAANCDDSALTRGQIYAESSSVTAIDLAENYPTKDETLVAGELVMADIENPVFVKRYSLSLESGKIASTSPTATTTAPAILGVISTKPGLLLGGFGDSGFSGERQVPVALSGRVPIKVNGEGGIIAVGDRLAPSSIAGVATKATTTGWTIGVALEPLDDESASTTTNLINVFVDKQFVFINDDFAINLIGNILKSLDDRVTRLETALASSSPAVNQELSPTFIDNVWNAMLTKLSDWGVAISQAFTRIANLVVGTVRVENQLCVDDVCVSKDQLKALLVQAGGTAAGPVDTPCPQGDTVCLAPTATTTPISGPTITIQGNNPAEIEVGTSYVDLGVITRDSNGTDLSVRNFVNGVRVEMISLDTSSSTTYTIDYSATDNNRLTATSTRTVIVKNPAPITENPPPEETSMTTPSVSEPLSEPLSEPVIITEPSATSSPQATTTPSI